MTASFINYAISEGFHLACLQDAYLFEGRPSSLPLSIPCYSSSSLNAHILILNNNLKHCLSFKSDHSVFINLDLPDLILSVGSLYSPPRADLENDLNDWRSAKSLSNYCLTLGDFNAHDPLWGYAREDARGRLLVDFILVDSLVILNDPACQPTYESGN